MSISSFVPACEGTRESMHMYVRVLVYMCARVFMCSPGIVRGVAAAAAAAAASTVVEMSALLRA
jgi:hypothetical protein